MTLVIWESHLKAEGMWHLIGFFRLREVHKRAIKAVARGLIKGLVHRQEGEVESIDEQTEQLAAHLWFPADVTGSTHF